MSPALIHAEFFVPVACQVAREALDLSYGRYPLVPVEDNCISAIPKVVHANYPQGVLDGATQALMTKLTEAAMISNRVEYRACPPRLPVSG